MIKEECPQCGGEGQVKNPDWQQDGYEPYWITCPTCSGRGWVFNDDPSSEVDGRAAYRALIDRYGAQWLIGLLNDRSLCGDCLFAMGEFYLVHQGTWRLGIPIKKVVTPVYIGVVEETPDEHSGEV